ncbi:MAG: hypothetical protein WEE53_02525 [Acidimicrobiia bacterium]
MTNIQRERKRSVLGRGLKMPLLVVALISAACAGGADGGDTTIPAENTTVPAGDTTTVPAVTTTEGSVEPQTLTMWSYSGREQADQNLVPAFEAASGNTILREFIPQPYEQTVLARWAAGERPDILDWGAIGNWMIQLDPEENLIAFNDEEFVSRYTVDDYISNSGAVNGQYYSAVTGYPYMDGVLFNRKVFAELGIAVPTNFVEVAAACETIKQEMPDVAPIFSGGGDQWPLQILPFIVWNDAIQTTNLIEELNTNQVDWTDPRIVEGIETQMELFDAGCFNEDILSATFDNEQTALMDGSAAMVFQGTWLIQSLLGVYDQAEVDENVGFAPVSATTNVTSWQSGNAISLPKTGDPAREAAAMEYVRFATGEGYQQYLEDTFQFPIFEGYDPPAESAVAFIEANDAFLANSVPQFQQTLLASYGFFEAYLQEMVSGQKTPLEVAEALETEFERSAAAIGLEGFGG